MVRILFLNDSTALNNNAFIHCIQIGMRSNSIQSLVAKAYHDSTIRQFDMQLSFYTPLHTFEGDWEMQCQQQKHESTLARRNDISAIE